MKYLNRREFGRRCAGLVAIAAVPVSASTVKLILPKLDPASGLASTLGYTHDVDAIPAQVLLAEHPNYVPQTVYTSKVTLRPPWNSKVEPSGVNVISLQIIW